MNVSVLSWSVPASVISYQEEPPEGFTCAVSAVEELAYAGSTHVPKRLT